MLFRSHNSIYALYVNSFGWGVEITPLGVYQGAVPTESTVFPTNGIAVTRAADECFVDYQLPPNTYRDLKGFKA